MTYLVRAFLGGVEQFMKWLLSFSGSSALNPPHFRRRWAAVEQLKWRGCCSSSRSDVREPFWPLGSAAPDTGRHRRSGHFMSTLAKPFDSHQMFPPIHLVISTEKCTRAKWTRLNECVIFGDVEEETSFWIGYIWDCGILSLPLLSSTVNYGDLHSQTVWPCPPSVLWVCSLIQKKLWWKMVANYDQDIHLKSLGRKSKHNLLYCDHTLKWICRPYAKTFNHNTQAMGWRLEIAHKHSPACKCTDITSDTGCLALVIYTAIAYPICLEQRWLLST